MNLEQLTALFRKLGAPNPESWAKSQHDEWIDQIARFAFLREAWKRVLPPDSSDWIDAQIAHARKRPDDPGSGAGPALERILATGADGKDIHEIVRAMQYEVLFGLCSLLEDPGALEPDLADLSLRLVRTNDAGRVMGTIDGLHESLLETDPSGREMRTQR